MRGFRALHISLLAPNLLLCAPHGRIRSGQLRRQLRHFQHRQGLPLLHVIAHIHVDFLDISRHLRVDIHILKRLELSCDRQRVVDWPALHSRHRRNQRITCWMLSVIRFRGGVCQPSRRAHANHNHRG